jgi:UDP-N-acetylglucosamine 3-dehydrogenase
LNKIGVGVIGVGFWGKNHARVFSKLENAKLVAVCDLDETRAKTVGESCNVQWDTNIEKFLKRTDIEAVSICTPTITHEDVASEAIEAGKQVFIEKPIAITVEGAKNILKKAEKKETILMVGFIERFNPAVQKAKAIIDEGEIGEVIMALAKRVSHWPERIGDVGVIKDTAIHDLDIMRFIFGENPLSVYARAGSLSHKFEDYAEILLGFSGVKTGFVEANWLTSYKVRSLTITGTEAIATIDYITQGIKIEAKEKNINLTTEWKEPLMLELKHFVDCVSRNEKTSVTGFDGLKALEMAEASLKSAETGKVINLG